MCYIYVPRLFRRRKGHEKLPRFHRQGPSIIIFSLSKQMGRKKKKKSVYVGRIFEWRQTDEACAPMGEGTSCYGGTEHVADKRPMCSKGKAGQESVRRFHIIALLSLNEPGEEVWSTEFAARAFLFKSHATVTNPSPATLFTLLQEDVNKTNGWINRQIICVKER